MSEPPRSSSHSRQQILDMILARIDSLSLEVRESNKELRDYVDSQSRATRELFNERLAAKFDAVQSEVRERERLTARVSEVEKWQANANGRIALASGLATLLGGAGVAVLTKVLGG